MIHADSTECTGRGPRGAWTARCSAPIKRGCGLQWVEITMTKESVYAARIGMLPSSANLDMALGEQSVSVGLYDDGEMFVRGKEVPGDKGYFKGKPVRLAVDTNAPARTDANGAVDPTLELVVTQGNTELCRLPVEEGWYFGCGGTNGTSDAFRLDASTDPEVRAACGAPLALPALGLASHAELLTQRPPDSPLSSQTGTPPTHPIIEEVD
jgi:hypothetical protein